MAKHAQLSLEKAPNLEKNEEKNVHSKLCQPVYKCQKLDNLESPLNREITKNIIIFNYLVYENNYNLLKSF